MAFVVRICGLSVNQLEQSKAQHSTADFHFSGDLIVETANLFFVPRRRSARVSTGAHARFSCGPDGRCGSPTRDDNVLIRENLKEVSM